jgi:PAS domain S-box-containing protein
MYLNLAGTLFVAVDTELRITTVNKTTCEILGYDESEMIGKKWFDDFIPERIKGEFEAEFSKLLEGSAEEIRAYEHPVWTKSGAEKVVAWYNTLLRDDSGKIVGALKSGIDVTTLKETEQALKRSKERYALAQTAANIGSWDWDIRTGHLYWSDQIEPMFGFGRGEFEGTYTAFLQAVHPDDRQYVIDSVNGCVERGQDYAIEHRIVWPDGTVRWVAESGDVSRDESGNAVRMYGVVQDITSRKEAEEALKAAHDELEQRVLERTAELARVNEQLRMEHEALERKNIALQEVLSQIDAEKKDLKRRVAENIEESILPTLIRLKESSHPSRAKTFQMLEKDLHDIAAPFVDVLRGKLAKLSPRETEICRMIRGGLTSKEIAASLNSSEQTVLKQRKTIRKKLGISNKLVNLTTFLKSLELKELKKSRR